MKYFVVLVLGMLVGVAILATGMIYNPFAMDRGLSPISVSDSQVMTLSYSGVPSESILFTNDGESHGKPFPEKTMELWEAPIRRSSIMTTVIRDARSQTAGIGVKFSSHSEKTKLLRGEALVDSVWYLYLPGRGSLFIEQSENYWTFLRDVVLPAYGSSSNNWRGTWFGDLTAGPGALGTAKVTGGTGSLQGLRMEGLESLSAQAYSADEGPISVEGRLSIELPADGEDDTKDNASAD